MSTQCVSIRSREHPGERCSNKAHAGTDWCGKHKVAQRRFVPTLVAAEAALDIIAHLPAVRSCERLDTAVAVGTAAQTIFRTWRRWLARRAGPLLWARAESNNPCDFFSGDPAAEIPLRDFISFVDGKGKGYIMDIKSAVSLMEHAVTSGEIPTNPFNRDPLPPAFHSRLARHGVGAAKPKAWTGLKAATEAQTLGLAVTDLFRAIEDLGYYTDPEWFIALDRINLQRFYMELADIWHHRASLSAQDRQRIVPAPATAFGVSVNGALIMQQKALRPLLIKTCTQLVSAAANRSDKQLGVMYVLGALSIVSAGAGTAYPWLVEMFAPGRVTRLVNGQLIVLHPSVLAY